MSAPTTADAAPEVGQLVRVRGQQWVVAAVHRSLQQRDELSPTPLPGSAMVRLTSVSDDDLGDELTVVWEVEPGREVLPSTSLPDVTAEGWDDPERFAAFLDAVRWGTVASADERTLQAPFRAGISIEPHQLAPVARALAMPRVNLLIADDVGLGKTIEAGLVAQELLLRHRARRIIVVCPASLTGKWHDEMAEKFGLDFVVLDAAALRDLRRDHGLQANPFAVHPRTIISLQWLRSPRVQRLLDEVLTGEAEHQGFFDLLVVDEAHHCAPPAPRKASGYAVDSRQTHAVRRLGASSRHRLFLSATPHNGHRESWQALLEILDPQRFTRGIDPDPAAVRDVMIRRLKDDLRDDEGAPLFPPRMTRAIEVPYTDTEQRGHELLERYLTLRRRAGTVDRGVRANDLIALLLKKRLFSSPAAFARTLAAHADRREDGGTDEVPDWINEIVGWDDGLVDDETADEAQAELLTRLHGATGVERGAETEAVLGNLREWADAHAEPADSKARALIHEIRRVLEDDERILVFTEYVDTLVWLAGLLDAAGLGGKKLGLIFGGMDPTKREHLKAAFQAHPDRDPVRILLATDAAGEGIDLQRYCHRVVHYDIPFNPNRLEQRIGRVDRHGQHKNVIVCHFVGAGWRTAAPGSYEADLEFLARVAKKVAVEREDLGSVNPVMAGAVEARMLGRATLADPSTVTPKPTTRVLKAEQDLRDQVTRLRAQLATSVEQLQVAPENIRRVVDTALALAEQEPLTDVGNGVVAAGRLRRGWERTLQGHADPLTGAERAFTFDPTAASEDVVLAHLGHPLVAQSTRLLRSAVWGSRRDLHRVAAVRATLPDTASIDDLLVVVLSRLVVVGADGARLHEEVLPAGRVVATSGRGRRLDLTLDRNAELRRAVAGALAPGRCRPAPAPARERIVADWSRLGTWLREDVEVQAHDRVAALATTFTRRAAEEEKRVQAVFAQLRRTLQDALVTEESPQLSFADLDRAEQAQVERDREAWRTRLDSLDDERDREVALVTRRFAQVRELVFPFAVAVVVPDGVST